MNKKHLARSTYGQNGERGFMKSKIGVGVMIFLIVIGLFSFPVEAAGYYEIDRFLMAPTSTGVWWTKSVKSEDGIKDYEYPQLSHLENPQIEDKINRQIEKLFVDYLNGFDIAPILSGKNSYEVTFFNQEFLGIVFYSSQNYDYGSHPINYWFSMNFSVATGENIILSDYLTMDSGFIDMIFQKDYLSSDLSEEEKDVLINEYILPTINSRLEENAHIIVDEGGASDFYSFLDYNGKLGLLINQIVPTAVGQNIQLNIPIEDLHPYLKMQ